MASEKLTDSNVDERGIPLKSSYPAMPVPVMYTMFTSVFLVVSLAIAFAIYHFGSTSKYDQKIHTLTVFELGWVYVGLYVIKLGAFAIDVNLGVARKESKVNVPDQQVYKVHGLNAGYVLMEADGVIGQFNRAQRAYMNYLEQQPLFLAYFVLAGFVFPFPAFVCGCIFSFFRIVAAVGYTKSADDHMKGNILSMIAMGAIEGLLLLAGVKSLM